jgi:4-carboxymuconolactone decarboxylase
LQEIAIMAAAVRCKSDFAFWSHANMGRAEGVDDAIIEALQAGEDPPFKTEQQRLVHSAAVHLVTDGDLPRPLRDRLAEEFGWPAVVELVAVVGFYCIVSFTLNAFDAALPEGVAPIWRG